MIIWDLQALKQNKNDFSADYGNNQKTSIKFQINSKFQFSMTKTISCRLAFGISNFGHLNLFAIWDLRFEYSPNE